ncbi:MAG: hypothetical protein IJY15_06560 [Thermoguttaceae bacterium]|nr:hypothetical protein [Thermoguttaceae bacterium]
MQISAFPPENAPKPSRVCAATGRPFEPGEKIFSCLYEENGEIRRRDLCADAFASTRRPENAIAWWSSRLARDGEKKVKLAPDDAALDLFESLADRPDEAALRYVLALLLTRRRILRFEREEIDFGPDLGARPDSAPSIVVFSPRRDASYVVPVVEMNAAEIAVVETRLLELVGSPAARSETASAPSASPLPFAPPTLEDDAPF